MARSICGDTMVTTRWEIQNKFDLESIKMLNKLLEGSGWTVGKICHEFSMLELDIRASKTSAYHSDYEDAKEMYGIVKDLEDKRDAIVSDLRSLEADQKGGE